MQAAQEALARHEHEQRQRSQTMSRRQSAIRSLALKRSGPTGVVVDLQRYLLDTLTVWSDDCNVTGTTCQGFLAKRGAVVKNIKRRWFVLDLNEGTLAYYTDKDKRNRKGSIPIPSVLSAVADSGSGLTNAFAIVTADRTYYCQAATPESRAVWLGAINAVTAQT